MRQRYLMDGLAAAGLAVLAACGEGEGSQRVTVRDSAGIRIVASSAPAWPDGGGWRLSREPLLRIGVVDGAAEYVLHRVSDVMLWDDGVVVVADGGTNEIRWFDSSGMHVRTVGRSGRGPGEFARLSGLVRLPGDTLAAFDGSLRRLTLIDGDGSVTGAVAFEPTGDEIRTLGFYRASGIVDGGFAMMTYAFPADMRRSPELVWDSVATLLYHRDGTLADTIGEFMGMDLYATPTRSGDIHFARYSSGAAGGGLLYMTDGGAFDVRVYDGTSLRRIVRLERARRRVDDARREELSAAYRDRASDADSRRRIEERLESWPWAETLPWISRLEVDARGNLWAAVYEHAFVRPSTRWEVFDTAGGWLGTVDVPEGFDVHAIGEDRIAGVHRDEAGVEYVHVYGLIRELSDR